MIKYNSAFIEDKTTRISISDISPETKNEHKYYCIGCGKELIARIGNKRNGHFAHKISSDDDYCNKETYLHKLGKLMLEEKFCDETKPFSIQLCDYPKCSESEKCIFHDKNYCVTEQKVLQSNIDIRKYYDSIVVETPIYVKKEEEKVKVSFDSFEGATKLIPDLLIYDSHKDNLKDAILLEVCYSHKCEQQKIDSELRIIEVYVRSEEYIEELMDSPFVQEDEEIYIQDRRKKPNILCYNFKTQAKSSSPLNVRGFDRFVYFEKGTCYVPQLHEIITCDKKNVKIKPHSYIELNLSSTAYFGAPNTLHVGLVYLKKKGLDIKNCLLCKYYIGYEKLSLMQDRPFCSLSKKFNTNRFPTQDKAKECQYYLEDKELINKAMQIVNSIKIEEV